MLPFFQEFEPFFAWTPRAPHLAEQIEVTLEGFQKMAEEIVPAGERHKYVGVIGFSTGGLVASHILLANAQSGGKAWPNLQFAALFNADYRPEIFPAGMERLSVQSVHLFGDSDPFAKASRGLMADVYVQDKARSMTFKGGHHLPPLPEDMKRLADMILDAYIRASKQETEAP